MSILLGFYSVILFMVFLLINPTYGRRMTLTASTETTPVGYISLDNTTESDTLQTGIDNLVDLLENLEAMSEQQLQDTLDRGVANATSAGSKRRSARDTEYKAFFCGVNCFLRAVNPDRKKKVYSRPKHFLLECIPSESDYPAEPVYPVSIDCVSHFTGSLIHVVLNLDNENKSHIERGFVTIGEHFAPALTKIGHFYPTGTGPVATGLYITLNVPITELTFEDLQPLKPWLKYIALNGEYLRSIDEEILSKLNLNYFVLEECTRHDMVVDPYEDPTESSYSSLRCRVMWRFTCPNSAELEILADDKTQNRLCGKKPGEETKVSVEYRPRRRRSPRIRIDNFPSKNVVQWQTTTPTPKPTPTLIGSSSVSDKSELDCSGVMVRDDIVWYQTAIFILFGLLALLIVLMILMLIAFSIVIRKTWREKLKPV